MVFRKLRNLVAQQAQAAASKETANNQLSSDVEQPEPVLLVHSLRSLPTTAEFVSLFSPTKATREKVRFLKVKKMKFPSVLLLTKAVKVENKTLKFKIVQTPLN